MSKLLPNYLLAAKKISEDLQLFSPSAQQDILDHVAEHLGLSTNSQSAPVPISLPHTLIELLTNARKLPGFEFLEISQSPTTTQISVFLRSAPMEK